MISTSPADRRPGAGLRVTATVAAMVPALLAGAACSRVEEAPAPAREVTLAYPSGPATLVPHRVNEEFAFHVIDNLYEELAYFDRGLSLQPVLAQGWHNEDDSTWVFTLRAGVRFHDGSVLTAADVIASIEAARSDPESKRQSELTPIASLELIDDLRLRIRTHEPYAALPQLLATVSIWKPGATPDAWPVGTGPYRLRSWTPEGTSVEAFPDYRDGAPPITVVNLLVIPDPEERMERLRRGEVDFVPDVPEDVVERTRALPDVRVATEEGLRVIFLGMDCASEKSPHVSASSNPFRDPRVREAVEQALDRDAIVAGALGGLGRALGQVTPPGSFGYHERLPQPRHDPEVARRALAEAGFAEGFEVPLDYMPHKFRAMEPVVAAIVAHLAEVGIRVLPRQRTTQEFFRIVRERDTAFYLWGWLGNSGDAGITYGYLLHSRGQGFGVANAAGYANPELDSLLAQASRTLAVEDRRALLWSAAEIVARDRPLIPLYRQTDVYAMAADLEFQPRADRRIEAQLFRWKN